MDVCASETPTTDRSPQWTLSHPYQKLALDQIRLIRIPPLSDDAEAPLRCTLDVYTLSSAPAFSALSYTWGDALQHVETLRKTPARPTRRIYCNGKEGHVGQNLYDFLAHHASGIPTGSHLWIDALSINQGNTQERSEQVKLMSQIYQTAIRVLVWLGPEDHMTESAISLLKQVLLLTPEERSALHPIDAKSDHANPSLDLRKWEALALFFQREWFRRTCTYNRSPSTLSRLPVLEARDTRSFLQHHISSAAGNGSDATQCARCPTYLVHC
jgi:hypothetical protein